MEKACHIYERLLNENTDNIQILDSYTELLLSIGETEKAKQVTSFALLSSLFLVNRAINKIKWQCKWKKIFKLCWIFERQKSNWSIFKRNKTYWGGINNTQAAESLLIKQKYFILESKGNKTLQEANWKCSCLDSRNLHVRLLVGDELLLLYASYEENAENECKSHIEKGLNVDHDNIDVLLSLANFSIVKCADKEALQALDKINQIISSQSDNQSILKKKLFLWKLIKLGEEVSVSFLKEVCRLYIELKHYKKAAKLLEKLIAISDSDVSVTQFCFLQFLDWKLVFIELLWIFKRKVRFSQSLCWEIKRTVSKSWKCEFRDNGGNCRVGIQIKGKN
jgi:hypothetical protein